MHWKRLDAVVDRVLARLQAMPVRDVASQEIQDPERAGIAAQRPGSMTTPPVQGTTRLELYRKGPGSAPVGNGGGDNAPGLGTDGRGRANGK